jgi:hypothetical protein
MPETAGDQCAREFLLAAHELESVRLELVAVGAACVHGLPLRHE